MPQLHVACCKLNLCSTLFRHMEMGPPDSDIYTPHNRSIYPLYMDKKEILDRREEIKQKTLALRRRQNLQWWRMSEDSEENLLTVKSVS